ncbi:hypothetical protein J4460_08155 [Candidatus Woesearchaeota archaeon]|nr:MAG: tRNA methylase [archaeon GW2011_AR4]MBS3130612.1 hypothetical protein [Candidatus Woesearchaeota archaeon]HIH39066.1 hypothetical protein [Candidatus Woesearchaeota archaeon]HIH48272.1 hypothetical protein [Candidatus Woesearchaeota archaeon]HIJ03833.1 hypothetical protein [Candidatus Woesearchaeota archaeon]
MTFDLRKKQVLAKIDKSKKGSVDEHIKPVLDYLNKQPDYYTTSSCSGRILVMSIPRGGKKNEVEWLFVSHDPVKAEEVRAAFKSLPKHPVWFQQEPMILHVCCKTTTAAERLLQTAKKSGFKHSGITGLKRIIVELVGCDEMATIIADDGGLVIDAAYLEILVHEANERLSNNLRRIKRLYALLKG